MKALRHSAIVKIIHDSDIETQEELADRLRQEGYNVTQATVSRDIRELKLVKITGKNGVAHYSLPAHRDYEMDEKYARILKDGFVSVDMAQNILVIKTVPGMAMAVCAAVDSMHWTEIVGSIAGDDTIMCAVRTVEETGELMEKIRKIVRR